MDLIGIIVIIAVITKIMNKAGEAAGKVERYGAPENIWDQVAKQTQSSTYTSKSSRSTSNQGEDWKDTARKEIEKARKKAVKALREVENVLEMEENPAGTYQMPKQNVRTTPAYEQITIQQTARQQEKKSAMQQVYAGRMEARNTTILDRATKNADANKETIPPNTAAKIARTPKVFLNVKRPSPAVSPTPQSNSGRASCTKQRTAAVIKPSTAPIAK